MYFPTTSGHFINYDLDSTIYINFGQKDTVIHYQVQDRTYSSLTDNLGRKSYSVIRYLRKTTTDDWKPDNTYYITPTENGVELVENNMRFQILKLPIINGFSWKGNSYIDTYSLNSDYKYLDDWDYVYDSVDVPLKLGSIVIDSSIKVLQRDEFLGQDPKLATTLFAEKNYSMEKYGKNIGLIYKEFIHWEYQGIQPGRPSYFIGYGIKLTMTGHN
ncbi:MAG: hypothetical protein NVS3B19_02480 [Ginsengibacter sp.]